jgi:hypothetical protein
MRRLDPRNPKWTDVLVHGLFIMHRYDEAWTEIASSPLESFYMDETANLLLFRDDREYQRLQEAMQESCLQYVQPDCGWEAHIANRDYPATLDSLKNEGEVVEYPILSQSEYRRLLTFWLLNDVESLAETLIQWQQVIEKDLERTANTGWNRSNIGLAIIAGIQGDVEQAEQLINDWTESPKLDWADRNELLHFACRVLGMIAATEAAVKCIRDGLAEPSHVTPFFEPYLLFYDSIKDQPEFIEMLDDIDSVSPAKKIY